LSLVVKKGVRPPGVVCELLRIFERDALFQQVRDDGDAEGVRRVEQWEPDVSQETHPAADIVDVDALAGKSPLGRQSAPKQRGTKIDPINKLEAKLTYRMRVCPYRYALGFQSSTVSLVCRKIGALKSQFLRRVEESFRLNIQTNDAIFSVGIFVGVLVQNSGKLWVVPTLFAEADDSAIR